MGVIAEIARSSTVSWAPIASSNPYMVAAGSLGGSINTSFESGGQLEILSIDPSSRSLRPVLTAVDTAEKFTRLTWGGVTVPGGLGLIAGGMEDGAVQIWDVAALSENDQYRGLVFGGNPDQRRHQGPVKGLQFNEVNPQNLVSGGSDGELFIWELSGSGPNCFRLPTAQGATREEITDVQWNPKVPHIFGNTSTSGLAVVWDLKQKRPVIKIRSPHGNPSCSSLCWNPLEATQVIVTSDDANASHAVLWDLRSATSPLREYSFHRGGILASSWSPHDTDLVLTSGKDSRTICFSPSDGELLCEIPSGANWNFDVQWSPKLPGLFITSSFDGHLSVHSILTPNVPHMPRDTEETLANVFEMKASDFTSVRQPSVPVQTVEMKRAPNWFKRPSGVCFGFENKFATFCSDNGGRITVSRIGLDQSLAQENTKLEMSLRDVNAVREYLLEQSAARPGDSSLEMLQLQFELDARRKLLSVLGYSAPEGAIASPNVIGLRNSSALVNLLDLLEQQKLAAEKSGLIKPANNGTIDSAARKLSEISIQGPAPWEVEGGSILDESTERGNQSESGASVASDGKNVDALIRKAVVTGDFQSVVDTCFEQKRYADALVFANCAGPEAWEKARSRYLSSHSLSIMSVAFQAVLDPTVSFDKVASYGLSSKEAWTEVISLFATYLPGPKLTDYLSKLAEEVMTRGRMVEALECHILASNIQRSTEIWSASLQPAPAPTRGAKYAERTASLWEMVKRVRIMGVAKALSNGEKDPTAIRIEDDNSAAVFYEFAAELAFQGSLEDSIRYLRPLKTDFHGMFGFAGDLLQRAERSISSKRQPAGRQEKPGGFQQPRGGQPGWGEVPLRSQPPMNDGFNMYQPGAPRTQGSLAPPGGGPNFAQQPSNPSMGGMGGMAPPMGGMAPPLGGMAPPMGGMTPSMGPPPVPAAAAPPLSLGGGLKPLGGVGPTSPSFGGGGNPLVPPPQMGGAQFSPVQNPPPPLSMSSPMQSRNLGDSLQPPPLQPSVMSPVSADRPPSGAMTNSFMPMPPQFGADPVAKPPNSGFDVGGLGPALQGPPPLMDSQPSMPMPSATQTLPKPPSVMAPPTIASMPPSFANPVGGQGQFGGGMTDFASPPTQNAGMGSMGGPPPMQPVAPPAAPMPTLSAPPKLPAISTAPPSFSNPPQPFGMSAQPGGPPTVAEMAPPAPPPTNTLPPGMEQPPLTISGKTGASSRLPPSAEVAGIVAQTRERPASSQSRNSASQMPAVNVDEADTSSIPPDQEQIVSSVRRTYSYVQTLNSTPMYKKKMEDMSRKLGGLLQRMNSGMIGENEIALLKDLSAALDAAEYALALTAVKKLTKESWAQNHLWILALKRLIESAVTGH